mgnify:CR=1 FL=1
MLQDKLFYYLANYTLQHTFEKEIVKFVNNKSYKYYNYIKKCYLVGRRPYPWSGESITGCSVTSSIQNPTTYGRSVMVVRTCSNRSRSIPVGSHWPVSRASRIPSGISRGTVVSRISNVRSETETLRRVSGESSTHRIANSMSECATVKQGNPIAREFPRKISENDSATHA